MRLWLCDMIAANDFDKVYFEDIQLQDDVSNNVETFKTFVVDKYLDDEGNYIDYNKTNGNGDYKYPMLKAGLNYELYRDIDFAGTEFETLFNKGIPFNGKIDGKGYALKNINISVEKANFEKYIAENNDGRYVSHIGIFGELKNAVIKDVIIENVCITVADDVYSYVKSGDFATMMGATLKELTVGSLAAVSTNGTKIEKVEVSGTINAGAYSLYAVDYPHGSQIYRGLLSFGIYRVCRNVYGTDTAQCGRCYKNASVHRSAPSFCQCGRKLRCQYGAYVYVDSGNAGKRRC
jgi:hypothetical protein